MKHSFQSVALILMVLLAAVGCNNETKKTGKAVIPEANKEFSILGNYVSEAYSKRSEGYDWVSVAVTEAANNQLNISVRSRADKKKPTCTFDALASKIDDNTYQTQIDGKSILFQFRDEEIHITAEKEEEDALLYFYCSGGGSIGGTYSRINETLDQSQIDKTQFSKVLNLQGIGFDVSVASEDGSNKLMISTFGLSHDYNETKDIGNQTVAGAEVEDLNSDGSPELIVFTKEINPNINGIYAFSVNNKKSLSEVYFPPTKENNKINEGYQGEDEFAVVETNLVQRFPIYKNGTKTGKLRQVSYQLVDGEASRKFVIHRIDEF